MPLNERCDNLFAKDEVGVQCQPLMDALIDCADDDGKQIYDYMESMPKTSFVVHLVHKLNENGFKIVKDE